MVNSKLFKKDFERLTDVFPKLNAVTLNKNPAGWLIAGEIDITDSVGQYWETFELNIFIPGSYPNCVPIIREVSSLIPREEDYHISDEGVCCIGIDHKLIKTSRKGIKLDMFIKNEVYPYLSNQLYKLNSKSNDYAGEEYDHYFSGIVQFYREELNIERPELAINIIELLLAKELPRRNDECICKRAKYKHCHLQAVEFLQHMTSDRLYKDLEGFKKMIK